MGKKDKSYGSSWTFLDYITLGIGRAAKLGFKMGRGKGGVGLAREALEAAKDKTRKDKMNEAKKILKEKGSLSFKEAMEVWGVKEEDLPSLEKGKRQLAVIYTVSSILSFMITIFQDATLVWMASMIFGLFFIIMAIGQWFFAWRIRNRTMDGFGAFLSDILKF